MTFSDFDVLIIGAGAAGIMCAIEAGKRGRRALLLEQQERVGKKIAIPAEGTATSPTSTLRLQTISRATRKF